MNNYLKSSNIIEDKIDIKGIPAILFRPKDKDKEIPTVIFYHGWSSNKESQRIRGFLLAALGYQVVIPDAINHGERNPLDNYEEENIIRHFWDTVLKNLEEGNIIIDELISKYNTSIDKIGVMGHSMGGITASGVFTHNPKLKTAVVLNGSCSWQDLNNRFKENFTKEIKGDMSEEIINQLDPGNNLDLLIDRPILLQNGGSDIVVPPESQEGFYNKIVSLYKDKEKISFLKYKYLNHFVTTNMMEDSIAWLYKYLY